MRRMIISKGKYCQLSRVERLDLGFIKKWRNEQREVLRQNKILTDKDQRKWFELLQHDKSQKIFSIVSDSRELLGYCGITHIDLENKRGEISFLLKTRINKELYREIFIDVLNLLKRYSFVTLHLHKIFTETFAFRKFHIGILEKFGFKREGVLVDQVFKKGKFYNSLLHYILN